MKHEEEAIELPPVPPRKTLGDFKAWLKTLPAECDDWAIESVVGGMPSASKRVIAYRNPDGGGGICVNSMGTHLPNEFWNEVQIIHYWTP